VLLEWDEAEEPEFSFLPMDASGDRTIAASPAMVVLLEDWQQVEIADLLPSGVQLFCRLMPQPGNL
jgi:hypothetical protein